MTPNTFFIADTHFGHTNILTFLRDDGTFLRDFSSVEAMDETMVHNWNNVVRDIDLVYHLGDVAIHRRCVPIVGRLKGRKRLVKGNHDLYKLADYTPYFEDIIGVKALDGMILSHIPIHPECLETRFGVNVHGHLHANKLQSDKHICVSVEHIDYTPIALALSTLTIPRLRWRIYDCASQP